jgi:outer membrane biosynthesis protein TonB
LFFCFFVFFAQLFIEWENEEKNTPQKNEANPQKKKKEKETQKEKQKRKKLKRKRKKKKEKRSQKNKKNGGGKDIATRGDCGILHHSWRHCDHRCLHHVLKRRRQSGRATKETDGVPDGERDSVAVSVAF